MIEQLLKTREMLAVSATEIENTREELYAKEREYEALEQELLRVSRELKSQAHEYTARFMAEVLNVGPLAYDKPFLDKVFGAYQRFSISKRVEVCGDCLAYRDFDLNLKVPFEWIKDSEAYMKNRIEAVSEERKAHYAKIKQLEAELARLKCLSV